MYFGEFLNLFRAGREGQGKELSASRKKFRQPKRGRGGRGVWGGEFRLARSGAERQFRSKKFRAKFRISHHKILSEFFEPDGSIASRLRRSAGPRPARRDAAKSHGSPNETETFIRV